MHPPAFHNSHYLLDWPDCMVELRCACGRSSHPGTRLLASKFGNVTFAELLPRLVCEQCRRHFAPVYVVAGFHREFCHGGAPSWSIELVPVPREG